MKPELIRGGGCDAVDVAALWPATAQLAGLPLPNIEPEGRSVSTAPAETKTVR